MEVWRLRDFSQLADKSIAEESVIENSFLKYIFRYAPVLKEVALRRAYISTKVQKEEIGFTSLENIEHYMPAIERIRLAIKKHKPIFIWGDYDVDGMTATAAMGLTLSKLSTNVSYGIPSRVKHGYGINTDYIIRHCEPGTLIITVDNGIAEYDSVEFLKSKGFEVIITDHHLPDGKVPDTIVVDPKLFLKETDGEYVVPGVYISAKIAYHTLVSMSDDRALRDEIYHSLQSFVTFGIISDVIEFNALMREQVKRGLVSIIRRKHDGIKALLDICGIRENQPITSETLAFSVVPKLNAAGRMDEVPTGMELLLMSKDFHPQKSESTASAIKLKYLNLKRKALEDIIFSEADKMIQQEPVNKKTIVVYSPTWHMGVIGIIASKIQEKYRKPCIVLTNSSDNTIVGSGRSDEGIDLFSAIKSMESLLIRFGGHRTAAGLEFDSENLESFKKGFEEYFSSSREEPVVIPVDAIVEISDIEHAYILPFLDNFGPFGNGNREIVFQINKVTLVDCWQVKDMTHARISDMKNDSIIISKYRAPSDWSKYIGEYVDVLVTPRAIYFTGEAKIEWRAIAIQRSI